MTTDPNDPKLKQIKSNGQQETYLVLSDEEIAKGFIRPVRDEYIHDVCGTKTQMGYAIAETYARDPWFYGGTFCVHCGKHFPLRDAQTGEAKFHWLDGTVVGD